MPDAHSLKMSREGRVLIPARLRRRLQMKPGSDLVVRVEDGKLVLESRANMLSRLQARFEKIPEDMSLSEELIEERRREVSEDEEASEDDGEEI